MENYFKGIYSLNKLQERYRQLSIKLHPDTGGSHEEFVNMQNQYRIRKMFFKMKTEGMKKSAKNTDYFADLFLELMQEEYFDELFKKLQQEGVKKLSGFKILDQNPMIKVMLSAIVSDEQLKDKFIGFVKTKIK